MGGRVCKGGACMRIHDMIGHVGVVVEGFYVEVETRMQDVMEGRDLGEQILIHLFSGRRLPYVCTHVPRLLAYIHK